MEADKKHIRQPEHNHIATVHSNITLKELEHIAECDICAEKFAEDIKQYEMIKAPHYLKENIIKKTWDMGEGQERKKLYSFFKLNRKNLQLLRYSMKIGLAMCGALALLLLTPAGNTAKEEPSGIINFLDKINYELSEFSNNMVEYTEFLVQNNKINKEDIKHDREKE